MSQIPMSPAEAAGLGLDLWDKQRI